MPSKNKEAIVNELTQNLVTLVHIFRQGGKAKDFKWWNENSATTIFYPLYGYQDGAKIFESVVKGILGLNSDMLSEYWVQRRLMFDFLEPQVISSTATQHLKNQGLVDKAKSLLTEIVKFEAWQDVEIPIANLWHEGKPIEFLNVTFVSVNEDELKLWEKNLRVFWHEGTHNMHVLAKVRSPGDEKKAIDYARSQVDIALEVLKAFSFPFGQKSDTWRIGVVGDVISYTSTPMSIDGRRFLSRIGSGTTVVELEKHILQALRPEQWEAIKRFILKQQHNKMEQKLRDSIHWLAESTKPDTNNSKFAKISFALETLVGGEPKDENLQVRGITAMLAERAAFIAGRNLKGRCLIDKDIRKYYGIRSKIVHGEGHKVSLGDIDKFGNLVRRLTLILLEMLDQQENDITSVEKLEEWVRTQRYTLPNDESSR